MTLNKARLMSPEELLLGDNVTPPPLLLRPCELGGDQEGGLRGQVSGYQWPHNQRQITKLP